MLRTASLATLLAVSSIFPVGAADFSFTGNLARPADIAWFQFSLVSDASVLLRTWSYAGGTNASGESIPNGGFDPIVSVFDATGVLIDFNDDDAASGVDPVSGNAYDAALALNLLVGDYFAALSVFNNFPLPTSAFIFPPFEAPFGPDDTFKDLGRSSFYALDISNVDAASVSFTPVPVPLPAALVLFAPTLLTVVRARRAV